MWGFGRQPTKDALQARRVVRVGGFTFTIRRISPLIDFAPERMPQIFSANLSTKKLKDDRKLHQSEAERIMADIAAVIEAGVVEPVLVPVGKGEKKGREDGITVEDILRFEDVAHGLYQEIMSLSMTKYRGWRGVVEVARNKALMVDAIAKRYGQRPSEVAMPDASPAEAQMFDAFVASEGIKAEADAHKEALAKVKRG